MPCNVTEEAPSSLLSFPARLVHPHLSCACRKWLVAHDLDSRRWARWCHGLRAPNAREVEAERDWLAWEEEVVAAAEAVEGPKSGDPVW